MKKNSQTEVGPTKGPEKNAQIDALNQVFALFRRNYHNQYFKAFAQETDVAAVKRLWLDALRDYDAAVIQEAALNVVKQSEFLPTLKTMLDHCKRLSHTELPDPHQAYQEACCAPSPKLAHPWSHPIVYWAGLDTGWHFLHSSSEHVAFPIFRTRYLTLCERVQGGELFKLPEYTSLEELPKEIASKDIRDEHIASLKSLFDGE